MSDVMMLAQKKRIDKLTFPCIAFEKLDGVPAVFGDDTDYSPVSRQGKPLPAVQWMQPLMKKLLAGTGRTVIGELWIPGKPFKEISGLARQHEPAADLGFYAFDCYRVPFGETYKERLKFLRELFRAGCMRMPNCHPVFKEEDIDTAYAILKAKSQAFEYEGTVLRNLDAPFELTRSWSMQKDVRDPVVDLKVVRLERASANKSMKFMGSAYKAGEELPCVGALVCSDAHGKEFTVGPGTLTHEERYSMNRNPEQYIGRIAVVKHKKDSTYSGLRQPTFQRWHEDKTVPDEV